MSKTNFKLPIFAVLLVLLSSIVLANYDITVEDKAIVNEISENGIAKFELNIINNEAMAREIIITPQQQYGKWRIDTPEPYILKLQGNSAAKSIVSAYPVKSLPIDYYSLSVNVATKDGLFSKDVILNINLVPPENKALYIEIPQTVVLEAGKEEIISFDVTNTQDYDLNKINIILESELFRNEKEISIDAKEKDQQIANVNIENNFEEGFYKLIAKAYYKKTLIGSAESSLKLVNPLNQKNDYTVEKGLFSKVIRISKENKGDVVQRESISIPVSSFEKLFIKFSQTPDSIQKDGSGYIYIWQIALQPGEKFELNVRINYLWFVLIVLVIILIAMWLFLRFTRRVTITKKVINISRTKEGIKGARIMLLIKNRGPGSVKNLMVVDRLPELIGPGKHYGTIKPLRVEHGRNYNRVLWEIPFLEAGEERVISYEINTNIDIIGKFKIPSAYVKYHTEKNNRQKIAHSGKFFIGVKE